MTTYDEAKKEVLVKWLIGAPTTFIASISSAISALKMFYFGLGNEDQLSHIFAQPVKQLVELIYQYTAPFLYYFWVYSPLPTPNSLYSSGNIYSLIVYLLVFVGMAFIGSARSLSATLTTIDHEINNEIIKASRTGSPPRYRYELQESLSVPNPGFFSKFHALYLAPIIVGLVIALIAKLSGLVL